MIIRAKISKVLSVCTFITVFGWRFCASQENNTAGNACHSYATCGAFGSCNSQETPICSCLQGFEPENRPEWDSGNWTGGCLRKVPLSCQSRNNMSREDGFLKIERIKVPGYSTRLLAPESECPRICLTNCSCLAYAHDSLLGCMFWNTTLLDIERFPTGLGSDLHFRVAYSELGHKKDLKKITVAMVVIGLVLMSICVYFSWKWIAKERGRRRAISLDKNAEASESVESSFQDELNRLNLEEFPLFEFRTLANATNGFSDATKLGKGGFGLVYKGELADGREIAVKRLSRASGQGMHEFMNEVELISKLQHRNLVRILGCCVEKNEKMLIYEYMPNKSLDFFLFDESQQILDWKKRVDIVEGICRGLLYLHRDSRLKIIHRDLKPSNILLDNNWNPKISDFGMARIFARKLDHKRTVRVVGTYGYMAPEYAIEGKFSEKSDVFSFGVMILEIVSGRKNTGFYHHPTSANLLAHVWRLWNEGNIEASFDARILSPNNHAEIVRCVHIGLLCVQELPRDRPTISAVLSLLNSEITELPKPKQIAFASKPVRTDTAGLSSSQQSQRSSGSLNTVTLSILDGR